MKIDIEKEQEWLAEAKKFLSESLQVDLIEEGQLLCDSIASKIVLIICDKLDRLLELTQEYNKVYPEAYLEARQIMKSEGLRDTIEAIDAFMRARYPHYRQCVEQKELIELQLKALQEIRGRLEKRLVTAQSIVKAISLDKGEQL